MGVAARAATHTSYQPGSAGEPRTSRIASLDIVRGIVMILMAIDHVRVYSGVPAGGPAPGVFFTRWVTHFAAPAFALLAGTGIFLYGSRLRDQRALSGYLVRRGVILVALELTVLRLAWAFNADVAHYNLAGVIWMLGWCMILMAALIHLPTMAVGIVGVLIVVAQPLFTPISQLLPSAVGGFLYLGGDVTIGGVPFSVLYVIVPWIGVIAAGYAFGAIMLRDEAERRALCYRIGLVMTALFLIGAGVTVAMQPQRGNVPLVLRLLSQRKYPASPLFLLMTLGPTIAFLPVAERMRGWLATTLSTFGRVPMFYYLLHIPLIHASALVVSLVREGRLDPWLFGNHPFSPPPVPAGYRWSLGLLYLVLAIDVALLYVPCRWYAGVKSRDRSGLLRYL